MVHCAETEGWNQEEKKLKKAKVIPNEDATSEHFGEGRVSFPANDLTLRY